MPAAPQPRILLVDDNADNLMLMQLYLGDSPYHVDLATDGREAVEKYAAAPYDLVFMDLEMPYLDGYDATRAIRELERRAGRPPAPILVLTAHALDEIRLRCLDAGCTDFLVKPVRKSAVLAAIVRHLATTTPDDAAAPATPSTLPRAEQELLRPLLPVFFTSAAASLGEAGRALDRDDLTTVRIQGHKLKGSALSYGFDALGQAALRLERAGENLDAITARMALEQATRQLRAARRSAGLEEEEGTERA